MIDAVHSRRFLFQTLLASGPPGVPGPVKGAARASLTDLATRRGFATDVAEGVGLGDDTVRMSVSNTSGEDLNGRSRLSGPALIADVGPVVDLARKFFVTDTDLNDVGFL